MSLHTEVERAARLLREVALRKTIVAVETTEDTIVFAGVSHNDFVCHSSPMFCLMGVPDGASIFAVAVRSPRHRSLRNLRLFM